MCVCSGVLVSLWVRIVILVIDMLLRLLSIIVRWLVFGRVVVSFFIIRLMIFVLFCVVIVEVFGLLWMFIFSLV